MGDAVTFSLHDLIVWVGAIGPVCVGALHFYVKLNRWQDISAANDKNHEERMNELAEKIEAVNTYVVDESRDVRDRVKAAHDRINALESRTGLLEGWKSAQK